MNKLTLFTITLLLLGCKKYKVVDLNKNFWCEITQNDNIHWDHSSTSYDLILSMSADDEFITFKGYKFPLKSFDRKTGSGSHTLSTNGNGTMTLTLSDGFRAVSLSESLPKNNYYYSGKTKITTTGICTTLAPTEPFTAQGGNYDLDIQNFHYSNGMPMSSSYMGNYPVSFALSTSPSYYGVLNIDGTTHNLPPFYTHYNKTHSYHTTHYYTDTIDIYWSNGSLSYSNLTMLDPNQAIGVDTISYYYYVGVK